MDELKRCPFCDSENLKDCYVYIKCLHCGAEGPKSNNGNNDDHADYVDHQNAVKAWDTRTPLWVSVEDMLPEDSKLCAVFYTARGRPHGYALDHYHELDNCKGAYRWSTDLSTQELKVIYWQPLPPVPEGI